MIHRQLPVGLSTVDAGQKPTADAPDSCRLCRPYHGPPAVCYPSIAECPICCPGTVEAGYSIRAVQELAGHKNVETTIIYTHVMSKGENTVGVPLDIA